MGAGRDREEGGGGREQGRGIAGFGEEGKGRRRAPALCSPASKRKRYALVRGLDSLAGTVVKDPGNIGNLAVLRSQENQETRCCLNTPWAVVFLTGEMAEDWGLQG